MKQNSEQKVEDLTSSPTCGKPLVMGSTVFNEDCMTVMARYPDKFFDLAIVDPPYGIGNFCQTTGNVRGKGGKKGVKIEWNDATPSPEYFKELERVSQEQIIWGANYYNCFNGGRGAIIWDKNQPLPDMSQCEIASYSRLRKIAVYRQTWTNYVNDRKTTHQCEKPIKLYEWLLKNYAKEGFKILDTHLGSGSSRIAAQKMGFDFVGCEIDKFYFNAQEKRFKDFTSQLRLFG